MLNADSVEIDRQLSVCVMYTTSAGCCAVYFIFSVCVCSGLCVRTCEHQGMHGFMSIHMVHIVHEGCVYLCLCWSALTGG